jgi:hypothetical protein
MQRRLQNVFSSAVIPDKQTAQKSYDAALPRTSQHVMAFCPNGASASFERAAVKSRRVKLSLRRLLQLYAVRYPHRERRITVHKIRRDAFDIADDFDIHTAFQDLFPNDF